MRAEDINSIEDCERFIEGCLNDFYYCISTKSETMKLFLDYTKRLNDLHNLAMSYEKAGWYKDDELRKEYDRGFKDGQMAIVNSIFETLNKVKYDPTTQIKKEDL